MSPIAVVAAGGLLLATAERGSIAARDWLPYAAITSLTIAAVLASGGANRPRRGVLVPLACLTLLALWFGVSAGWASSRALARDEALLTVFYVGVLAVASLTIRTAEHSARALAVATAALGGLAVATGLWLLVDPNPGQMYVAGRLAHPVTYVNAQAAVALVGVWPALVLASDRAASLVARSASLGAAGAMLAVWLAAQSKGGGIALALSGAAVFALSKSRLRLLVPTAIAGAVAYAAFGVLTGPFRTSGTPAMESAVERVGMAVLVVAGVASAAGLVYAVVDRFVPVGATAKRIAGAVVLSVAVAAAALGLAAFDARVDDRTDYLAARWEAFKSVPDEPVPVSTHFANLGSNRYDFWRVSVDEFRSHPIRGMGTREFAAAYLQHGRSAETPERAHSLPLEILAENGVVGLAFFAAFAVSAFVPLVRRRADPVVIAVLGSTAYWFVHASGDWIWTVPASGVFAFLLLGIGLAAAYPARATLRSKVGLVSAAAVTAVVIVGFAPPWFAARLTSEALEGGSSPEGRKALAWAARIDRLSVEPFVAEAVLATSRPAGIPALERAVAREPANAALRYLLGLAYLDAGRKEAARDQLRIAHSLFPRDTEIVRALDRTN